MKRLLAILLALCMLVAMAGCGSNSSAGGNPPPTTESDTPSDPVITETTDDSADITEVLPMIESEYSATEVLSQFHGGRAWVKYEKDDRSTGYAIIDENGFIIASYDSTELGWGNYVAVYTYKTALVVFIPRIEVCLKVAPEQMEC